MSLESHNPYFPSIGIFDSGIGGLTVMKEIIKHYPDENIIYFGDTARLPYGEKSPETILRYSIENGNFLLEQQIKILVVACNTASAYALDQLTEIFNIPVIGMIEAGAKEAARVTKKGRIAILATRGTILSGLYQKELSNLIPGGFVFPLACPLFVPLLEEGFINHSVTKIMINEYLAPLKNQGIDTLLLGCTHYPLLKERIQEEMGVSVKIVDPAKSLAESLKIYISEENRDSKEREKKPCYRYFVSDDPEKFASSGSRILGRDLESVQKIYLKDSTLSDHVEASVAALR